MQQGVTPVSVTPFSTLMIPQNCFLLSGVYAGIICSFFASGFQNATGLFILFFCFLAVALDALFLFFLFVVVVVVVVVVVAVVDVVALN